VPEHIRAARFVAHDEEIGLATGTLRVRALATHITDFVFDTGVSRVDSASDVGSSTGNAIPNWRGTLSFTYHNEWLGWTVARATSAKQIQSSAGRRPRHHDAGRARQQRRESVHLS
jgi:hypothetical protein